MSLSQKRKNRRFERRHVLDVKLRASHRRQMRLRRSALVLIFLAAVGGGGFAAWRGGDLLLQHFVYRNPAFYIHYLDIQTDGVISQDQLRRWAGVRMDENLFALDLGRVKRDLELVPAIEAVQVERVLPHTLRIRITERESIARVTFPHPAGRGADQLYLIDGQGVVMFPLEPAQLASLQPMETDRLPGLVGVPPNDLRPGRKLNDERIRAALQLLKSFAASSMVGVVRLREIDVRHHGVLSVTTEDHCRITFGLRDFDAQLRRWRVIHDHCRRIGRSMAALDLSVSNNVPVRWSELTNRPDAGVKVFAPSAKRKNV